MKHKTIILAIIIITLNLIDFFTTKIIISLGGEEVNPLQVQAIEWFGINGVFYFKLLFLIPFLILILKYHKDFKDWNPVVLVLVFFTLIAYTLLVIHNIGLILVTKGVI